MNLIRQRMISLRSRAVELQSCLRKWALYDNHALNDWKEPLLGRLTPAEESAFESDLELTQARLRPTTAQIQTVLKWYDFVLERIGEQLIRAHALYEQNRHGECAALLREIERNMVEQNEVTLGFFFRCLAQHASHEYHQKLAAIDAIIRSLFLPTAMQVHQRGLLPREALSRTPLAYLADGPDESYNWRQHAHASLRCGRAVPISLLAVPRRCLAEPWNLTAIAHEVGRCIYAELELGWETIDKLQPVATAPATGTSISPATSPLWSRWHETIFGDVFGTIKLGPAYVSGMIELLSADVNAIAVLTSGSSVPPAMIRWQVMLQTLHLLNLSDAAAPLENSLRQTFGDFERFGRSLGASWGHWLGECRAAANLIAFSPYQKLSHARLVDIAQPFLATESQTCQQVRDLLLAGDASIATDDAFRWIEPISGTDVPAHVALAGLRSAYEQSCDVEASRRLWIRFWCMMQFLASHSREICEREDREFAPADVILRQLAQFAVPPISHVPLQSVIAPSMIGFTDYGAPMTNAPMFAGPSGHQPWAPNMAPAGVITPSLPVSHVAAFPGTGQAGKSNN